MSCRPPTLDVHLRRPISPTRCAPTSRAGLTATPKWLPPKWFYDARGSELFEEITRLPEYYPTRAEREILRRARRGDRRRHGADDPRRARLRLLGEDPAAARRAARRPGRLAPSCRSTCRESALRRGRARARRRVPGAARCTAWSPTSPTTWTVPAGGRAAAGGLPRRHHRQPLPGRAGRVPRRAARRPGARRLAPARRRPGQRPGGAGPRLRRRRRRDRRVQPQRAARAQPRARRRLRRRPLRARRASGTPTQEWIEMRLRATAR